MPFQRLVREITQQTFGKHDFRYKEDALWALQVASETILVELFEREWIGGVLVLVCMQVCCV